MSQRLAGKVAIVTGSSRGIGRAVALAFAREGASVVVNYSGNKAAADSTAEEALKHGGKVIVVQGDVSSMEDNKKLIEATVETFGKIDILALNAGLICPGKDLKSTTPEDFDKAFAVNVKGPMFTVKVGLSWDSTCLYYLANRFAPSRKQRSISQMADASSSSPVLSSPTRGSYRPTCSTSPPRGPSSRCAEFSRRI